MRRVCPRFTSSPSRDIILVAESMSKHGHLGLKGISLSHTSTKLPHVGHCDEIFGGLIGWNKLVQ